MPEHLTVPHPRHRGFHILLSISAGVAVPLQLVDPQQSLNEGQRVHQLSIVSTISVGKEPKGIAIGCKQGMSFIATASKQVTAVACCGRIWDLAAMPDSGSIYVAGHRNGLF